MKVGEVWFEEQFPQFQVKRPFGPLLPLRNCFVFVWTGVWLELVVSMFGGCCVGLIDESIEVLFPTREFDFVDLIKDWVRVVVAFWVVNVLKNG